MTNDKKHSILDTFFYFPIFSPFITYSLYTVLYLAYTF